MEGRLYQLPEERRWERDCTNFLLFSQEVNMTNIFLIGDMTWVEKLNRGGDPQGIRFYQGKKVK